MKRSPELTQLLLSFFSFCQPCRTGLRLEIDSHCVLRRITIFHTQQLEQPPGGCCPIIVMSQVYMWL